MIHIGIVVGRLSVDKASLNKRRHDQFSSESITSVTGLCNDVKRHHVAVKGRGTRGKTV